MIFDKSIKEGKLPFSCIDCIKAREFLDKEGYFTDNIIKFTQPDFEEIAHLGKLYDIDNSSNERPFQFDHSTGLYYKYFLPKEWVEKKNKYRPFTLAEWTVSYRIGEVIHFRNKKSGTIYCGMYVGNVRLKDTDIDNSSEGMLSLGVDNFALDYLFKDYEIKVNGEWVPFGIEE